MNFERLAKAGRILDGPIARGSMTSLAIRITGLGLVYLQAVLAARLLGVESYGIVSVALAVINIAAIIAVSGYQSLAIREVARNISSENKTLLPPFIDLAKGLVTRHAIAIAAVVACIAIAAKPIVYPYDNAIILAAISIPAMATIHLWRGISQGFGDVAAAQWPGELLRPAITITGTVALFVFNGNLGPLDFLAAVLASSLLVAVTGQNLVHHKLRTYSTDAVPQDMRRNWRAQARPFAAIAAIAILQGELAVLLLALFASPEEAGLYQPIARIAPLVTLPVQAAAMRYTPRLAETWESGQARLALRLTDLFTLVTFGLSLVLSLALIVAGPFIFALFGEEFVPMASILWIAFLGPLVSAACGPAGAIVTMIGRPVLATYSLAAGLMVQIVLGAALVPAYGVAGAVTAMSAGTAFAWLILLYNASRTAGFNPSLIAATGRLLALRYSAS